MSVGIFCFGTYIVDWPAGRLLDRNALLPLFSTRAAQSNPSTLSVTSNRSFPHPETALSTRSNA